jgi:hypothetical protein
MKTLISLTTRLFKSQEVEIQEAPRFEEWFNELYPRDKHIPNLDAFGEAMLEFKNEQKRKLTQGMVRSQSL